MTHEAARRFVSRFWLRAFAGIVAVLAVAPSARAAGETAAIAATERHSGAVFATQAGRNPTAVFLTESGVYELDRKSSNVMHVWQRSNDGLELFRPKNASVAEPMSANDAQRAGALRFSGKDAAGAGTQFKQPVGMDREPGGARFAVVNAGEWIERGNNAFCPSVQVYSFAEQTDSAGDLSGVEISFEGEFRDAFYTTTNGAEYVISNIVDTSYVTTNLLGIFYSTNWIHVISQNPYRAVTNETESGDAILLVATNRWEEEVYNPQTTTNYMWRFTLTTNANYLSTATDVAFLGSDGIMVSMTADERRTVPSGLIVFDLSNPAAKGALYPVEGLPGVIGKIAADPQTGDIYATVPDAGAVYRFKAPGGSWLSFDRSNDIGLWQQDAISPDPDFLAGAEGEPGSALGRLSSPGDLSVWYPASLSEAVILVSDTENNRVEAFDAAGTALFTFGGTSAKPFNRPHAVWGEPGADVFAVAEYSGSRVRIFEPDLAGVDADFILSLEMIWPSTQIDLSIVDGVSFIDAVHTSAVDSASLVVMESDEAENLLRFVVPPSRLDREYTLSFAGAAGVLEAVSATATVAAGETEGFFAFRARDGIVNADDGSVPVYRATVTAPSGATAEAWVAVLNARPTIVTPGMGGIDFGGGFLTTSFSVNATDVESDAGLSYLWFATTNFNWGVNHLDWAARNQDLFASADAGWTLLGDGVSEVRLVTNWVSQTIAPPDGNWDSEYASWIDYEGGEHFYRPWDDYNGKTNGFTITPQYACFFDEQTTTTGGTVTNGIFLYVAKGKEVAVPNLFSYYGYAGMVMEDDISNMGGIIVLAVVDKDGGAAIIRFGKDYDSQDSAWVPGASGGGDHENGAVYEGEFTDITPEYVSYVIRVQSGTADPADTVTIKSSTDFRLDGDNEWKTEGVFFPARYLSGGEAFGTNAIRMTEPVRFFRIFQP